MNSNTWDTDSRGRTGILVLAFAGLLAIGLAGGLSAATAAPGPTDLALTKSDSADPVTEGGNFVYTIQAANTGANDATDVIVTDVLPNQVGYVSATATSGSCTRQQSTVTCNLGTVDAGVTATVTIAVKATKSGTASNTAALSTTVTDANAANDQETETTVINKKAKGPGKGKKAKPSCAAPTIAGTAGADVLTGTRRADVIRAFAGNDRVYSLGGKDLVCADRGADIVNAGDGADTVIGVVAAATSWSEPKEATCSRGRRARIVCSAATGTTSSRGSRPRGEKGAPAAGLSCP